MAPTPGSTAAPTTAPSTIQLPEIQISRKKQGDPNSDLSANCYGTALCGVTAGTLALMQLYAKLYSNAYTNASNAYGWASDKINQNMLYFRLATSMPAIVFQMMSHQSNQDNKDNNDNQTPPPVPATTTAAGAPPPNDEAGTKAAETKAQQANRSLFPLENIWKLGETSAYRAQSLLMVPDI